MTLTNFIFESEPEIKNIMDCIYKLDNFSGFFDGITLPDKLSVLAELNDILEKSEYQCAYRDAFNARLAHFNNSHQNSLLTAVAGEIGNNTFDHNIGLWHDVAGLYFNWSIQGYILLIDRGQGIKRSLSRVKPDLKSDVEAIQFAFTERISGRAPERRGNGLKFVSAAIRQNNWFLYFQSGNGVCQIQHGAITFSFHQNHVEGCIAIVRYIEDKEANK